MVSNRLELWHQSLAFTDQLISATTKIVSLRPGGHSCLERAQRGFSSALPAKVVPAEYR